jgi:hypothetical protein
VSRFKLFDGSCDAWAVCGSEWDWIKRLVHIDLDVTRFEVVVVDFHIAANGRVLSIDEPL